MPLRVYRGKSKYELRPPGGKCIPICSLDATEDEVWSAYNTAIKRTVLTVDGLADEYFRSRTFTRKRPSTQKQYRASWKFALLVFSGVVATKVRPKHIRAYMDKRGETSEVSANREHSVLFNVFAYGYERGLVVVNPCKGVKKFPETPRDKYIEDDEYYPYLEKSTPLVQVLMEIAYCCGARSQDVRTIAMPDLRDNGIFIMQEKTGKKQIKEWTPRLKDAVEKAKALRQAIMENYPGVASPYLIVNQQAQPYTQSGFKSTWQKNRQRIAREHGIVIDWTYHDIKAKGVSDFTGDKQRFSGHKHAGSVSVYNRKVDVVPTLQTDQRPLYSERYSEKEDV